MAKRKSKTPLPPTRNGKNKLMVGNMSKAERSALNLVSQRFEFLQKAGFQYGAKRDLWAAAGYVRTPKFEDFWGMYKRGDIAGRIVDMAPKTTWRKPPTLLDGSIKKDKPLKPLKPGEELGKEGADGQPFGEKNAEKGNPFGKKSKENENEPPAQKKPNNPLRNNPFSANQAEGDESPFTKAVEELAKQLKLWRYFERVDRLAGVGRYAILLIGTRGTDDQNMREPLTKVANAKDIMYLATYHEQNARIETWVTDPKDPRFGMPDIYKVKFTSGVDNFRPTGASSELLVHHTRVIHVAEDLLEDEVYGRPRLERPMNRLFDLDKIASSTAEAYWQSIAKILQARIDPTADITDAQLTQLDERLMEMTHDLRRQFSGKGVDLNWLDVSVPPVKDIGDFYFSIIAGAAGIPKRILFGSELGELASTTDQDNWFGLISERQEQYAEPMILRPFIDKMIAIGALPPPKEGEYNVMWTPLSEDSALEKAQINQIKAQTAATLTPVGGNPQELVEIDEEGDLKLPPREQAEPMPIMPPGMPGLPGMPGETPEDTMRDGAEPPPFGGPPKAKGGFPFGKAKPAGEEEPEDEDEEEDEDEAAKKKKKEEK